MSITTNFPSFPDAPNRTSDAPVEFASKADAFVAAMEAFPPVANTVVGQMNTLLSDVTTLKNNAASSATSASNSATSSASSASSASTFASTATTAKNTALSAASNAETSATNAGNSATNASAYAAQALEYKNSADVSASEAATSAVQAGTYVSQAAAIVTTPLRMAVGNLSAPLMHLPLKNNLLTAQGQSICTLTRASTATYTDRYDAPRIAGTGAPRFTADGLLIEGASTNLLTYSEQFDDLISWHKAGCSISTNTANTTGPFGTNSADVIIENSTASSSHLVYHYAPLTSGITYAVSIFAKAKERTQIRISTDHGAQATFDLSNGTVVSTGGGVLSAAITPCANGWYRCSITYTATSTGPQGQYFGIAVSGTAVYTGDGTSGLYIFGAQLEAMPFPTSYITTTTAAATRAADSVSFPFIDNFPFMNKNFSVVVDCKLSGILTSTQDIVASSGVAGSAVFRIVHSDSGAPGKVGVVFRGATTIFSSDAYSNVSVRIGVVRSGTVLSLYINGVLVGSSSISGVTVNPHTIYLGKGASGNSYYGTVSNLHIYDRALTAEEANLA